MKLPRVYPVVDSAAWVGRMLSVGVRLIQLRVKERSASELRAEIREAKGLCARVGAQLIVNDYWLLAIAEGCDFVHLGQGDLDTADVTAIRKAGVKTTAGQLASILLHTALEQLDERGVEYLQVHLRTADAEAS